MITPKVVLRKIGKLLEVTLHGNVPIICFTIIVVVLAVLVMGT